MSTLRIMLGDEWREYRPGDQLEGEITWELEGSAEAVDIHLFYHTKGKGTQDVINVDSRRFEHPAGRETRRFQFQLPESPYSFSGKLISLVWAVEAVLEPGDAVDRVEFTLSPSGREIDLVREPASAKR